MHKTEAVYVLLSLGSKSRSDWYDFETETIENWLGIRDYVLVSRDDGLLIRDYLLENLVNWKFILDPDSLFSK